ncbi:activator of Hsp90 ATPase [Phakopsora pachyrhizi]|uniref:Activator of Hsp90 ATPase n=1 Tax=Phakopsora pachyrhizi TaxID=170000 RepID=A0AAV0ARE2_PHAPC|nr:activator of Hsp90 ATPase [Phakopsora pachyrhizi]
MSNFITNYHWRTKDLSKWAKDWFDEELRNIGVIDGLKIDSVTIVEGDCELGMRKAKLITIYDLRLTIQWSGEGSSGTFTVPEVSHDMEESDYVIESSLDQGGKVEVEIKARTVLSSPMRKVFQAFPKAMVKTHGAGFYKENGISPGTTPSASGTSTPQPNPSLKTKTAPTTAPVPVDDPSTKSGKGEAINTTTVRIEGQFMCSAADLFDFLTNEAKIPIWSRNPAKMKPEVDAEMSLFGGNIIGKVLSVDPTKEFVTTWRAPTWPAGHFGKLKATLNQGSDSTKLELRLSGVPVGTEEETERNLDIFYLRSLKQIGSETTKELLSSRISHTNRQTIEVVIDPYLGGTC